MLPERPPLAVSRELCGAVLACDLDGTYCRVNTFPRFVSFALRRLAQQRDLSALVRLGWAIGRRKVFRGSHLRFKAAVHDAGQRIEPSALRSWAADLLQSAPHDAVVDLVDGWGGPTLLVTAAPAVYADVLGELAGFTEVQGSDYDASGRYVENVHENKAARLRASLSGPLDSAITDDTVVDGPLLALAVRPLVVGPDGRVADFIPAPVSTRAAGEETSPTHGTR
ncbi:hypothetical protein O2W18_01010 [Modestobacter sp. VKM Ac-2983]|uniref:haloacid dehalogenase-like hydrolase n=1 Tax=Modestobacter sp. VKM Ac-2983 TaxID=3004137 RepID=UPI0022AB8E0D|nr:haloacid dehalogenase-like hydrolase [Modestobacter sp. VKM Ac-2983]MCZ2803679.1 hypothetical protein [Modestobacter sp. VKM Ac-2983]